MDWAAKSAGSAEAYVVEENKENVWSVFWRVDRLDWREFGVRIFCVVDDESFVGLIRYWQNGALYVWDLIIMIRFFRRVFG